MFTGHFFCFQCNLNRNHGTEKRFWSTLKERLLVLMWTLRGASGSTNFPTKPGRLVLGLWVCGNVLGLWVCGNQTFTSHSRHTGGVQLPV